MMSLEVMPKTEHSKLLPEVSVLRRCACDDQASRQVASAGQMGTRSRLLAEGHEFRLGTLNHRIIVNTNRWRNGVHTVCEAYLIQHIVCNSCTCRLGDSAGLEQHAEARCRR